MANCHKCGREIPRKTGVYKVMRTGSYTGGSDYHRTVNLCPRCAATMEDEDHAKKKKTLLVFVVGVLAIAGLAVYFLYFR